MDEKRARAEALIRGIWTGGVAMTAPIAMMTRSKDDDEIVQRCGRATYDGTLDKIIELLLGPKT